MQTFYGMVGWDAATGDPLPATLGELGVAWAIEQNPG